VFTFGSGRLRALPAHPATTSEFEQFELFDLTGSRFLWVFKAHYREYRLRENPLQIHADPVSGPYGVADYGAKMAIR